MCIDALLIAPTDVVPRDMESTIYFDIQAETDFSSLKRKAGISLIIPISIIADTVRSTMAPLLAIPMMMSPRIIVPSIV